MRVHPSLLVPDPQRSLNQGAFVTAAMSNSPDSWGGRILHSLARQLVETGRIDDDTYAAAERIVGHRGLVELVSLCGYYTLISFILNGFDVPLPPDVSPQWPD